MFSGSFSPKYLLSLMILASCGAAALAAPQTAATTSSPAQSQTPAPDRLSVETGRDSNLVIPRLPHGPALEDFLAMKPEGDVAPQMAKVFAPLPILTPDDVARGLR